MNESERAASPRSPAARRLAEGASMRPMEKAVAVMQLLRSPDGCPWDREQTFQSLQRYTLEEVYEVFDAIDREAWDELRDELGDLLLQVLFYAQMAADAGHFTMDDVATGLNEKLIRRHPHVFGEVVAQDAAAVVSTWEKVKRAERSHAGDVLADVPQAMPALLEAAKLGSRAAKVGFDWPDAAGVFQKLEEEIGELRAEMAGGGNATRVEEELGDVLFTVVNLARRLDVDAETGLRGSNRRFRRRFEAMERELTEAGRGGREGMNGLSAADWEELWRRAKLAAGQ